MEYGYARCSTNESKQEINRQVRELKQAGAEEIFLEYEHGDSKIKRQQQMMFEKAQPGDTIITLEVSRLARSTRAPRSLIMVPMVLRHLLALSTWRGSSLSSGCATSTDPVL